MSVLFKINKEFADSIYKKYQNSVYGINSCVLDNKTTLEDKIYLKRIYEFQTKCECNDCDLTKIEELINRL